MHKDSTAQAKQKKDEREEVLKEIRQLENRQKILENKQRNEERKARTRRLIERGAILEGVFPSAPRPFRRRGQGVPDCLCPIFPGAAELAAKLPKIRGTSHKSPCLQGRTYTPLPVSCALPGAVALSERDGALHSPNPLCAPRSQTPASRLSGSTEPEYPSPKGGGATHRFLSISPSVSSSAARGRSAVAAAAYRSGTKLTNEWDGPDPRLHPEGAALSMRRSCCPPTPRQSFQTAPSSWNSVEQIEKARDSQLAREIEGGFAP